MRLAPAALLVALAFSTAQAGGDGADGTGTSRPDTLSPGENGPEGPRREEKVIVEGTTKGGETLNRVDSSPNTLKPLGRAGPNDNVTKAKQLKRRYRPDLPDRPSELKSTRPKQEGAASEPPPEQDDAPGTAPANTESPGDGKLSTAQRAVGRAEKAGEALKRSLTQDDSASTEIPSPPPTSADVAAAQTFKIDPSSPKSSLDLAMAQISGFSAAFQEAGLRAVSGRAGTAIVRQDGTPASPEEVSALRQRIMEEPAALVRRPDFFRVLPRGHFGALKTAYGQATPAAQEAFKDVAITAQSRDFRWSDSCSRVSGDCNGRFVEQSYRKGDYVSPESLESMWKGIETANEKDAAEKPLPPNAAAAAFSRSVFAKGSIGRISGLLQSLAGLLGVSQDSLVEPAAPNATPSAVFASERGAAAKARAAADGGKKAPQGAARPRSGQPPPPAPLAESDARGGHWALASAGGLGALVILLLLRRRRS